MYDRDGAEHVSGSRHAGASGAPPKLFLASKSPNLQRSNFFTTSLTNIIPKMAPSRTSTVKSKHASKHAANKSGIRNSKNSTKPTNDGVSKPKSASSKRTQSKGAPQKIKGTSNLATLKKKRRVYTEKELNIPALNMITPIGVEKPKGKKKGKVFVDDKVCSNTFYVLQRVDRRSALR